MHWDVVKIKPAGARELEVEFADGTKGFVVIDPSFCHGVFDVLCDDRLVHAAKVSHGAVTWFGKLDLAPDAMYDGVKRSEGHRYIVRGRSKPKSHSINHGE